MYALTSPVQPGTRVPKSVVSLSGYPMEGETLEAKQSTVWCRTLKVYSPTPVRDWSRVRHMLPSPRAIG
eukprot:1019236-Pyramimonas_sp.AAC.1